MTAYTFLVTADVERESGMHASRDDIADRIDEALAEAVGNADLTGLGPQSNSDYTMSEFEVRAMERKELKDAMREHDDMVVADYPGDKALQEELKLTTAALEDERRFRRAAEEKLRKINEHVEQGKTRIYQRRSGDRDAVATYLADGQYDGVTFQYGEDRHDGSFEVSLLDGILEIRSNAMGDQLAIVPWSGNVVRLQILPREVATRR